MTKQTVFTLVLSLSLQMALFAGLGEKAARANADLDRQYALETVGFVRESDNVDGLFTDYVASAYRDYFSRQSRFVLQDLSKGDALLSRAKTPYNKLIQDPEILSQLARSMRSQSLLRTRILKEGHEYQFSIEWLHAPDMDVMAKEAFTLKEQSDATNSGLGDVKGELQKGLDRLVGKLPFLGHVTGRDNASVTVNLGSNAGLKRGDTLVVSTIDEVKKHPLLKAIVDWRLTPTGKLEIDSVDEGLSFAHVTEEDPNHAIARFQKITQVIPKVENETIAAKNENPSAQNLSEEMPKLGYATVGLNMGGFSRQFTFANGTPGSEGSGLWLGGKAEGQVWFNREFFADMAFGYAYASYGQHPIAGGADTASGTAGDILFKLDVGYSYYITGDLFGPRGWVKVGYKSNAYTFPISQPDNLSPITVKALFLGIGGDLPIRQNYGAELSLDFGVLPSASEVGQVNGQINSASDVEIFAGGYYRLNNRMTVRAGFDILADGAGYNNTGSLSQKAVSFEPSIRYYF